MAERHTPQSKEELQKEEILLQNVKEKLLDQLQRLKVEEMALIKYLSLSNEPTTSTATYFSQQVNPNYIEINQSEDQINSVPLCDLTGSLASNTLVSNNFVKVEEEEEEDNED